LSSLYFRLGSSQLPECIFFVHFAILSYIQPLTHCCRLFCHYLFTLPVDNGRTVAICIFLDLLHYACMVLLCLSLHALSPLMRIHYRYITRPLAMLSVFTVSILYSCSPHINLSRTSNDPMIRHMMILFRVFPVP